MNKKKLITAISQCIALSTLAIPAATAGDIFVVDSTSDTPESGLINLREAIDLANGSTDSVIRFDENTFSEPQTIFLQNGEMVISSSMTIDGPGADLLTIDAGRNSRIFYLSDDSPEQKNVEINALTLIRGNGVSELDNRSGGCVFSFENLSLNDSVITACNAGGVGGGVFIRSSELNINNSVISLNRAGNKGGALYARAATFAVTHSTLSGNRTTNRNSPGSAVYLQTGNGQIVNSTISNGSGRDAAETPAAIFLKQGTFTLRQSTVFDNQGVGVAGNTGNISISNSIIANNTAGDCALVSSPNLMLINNLDTDGSCDVEASAHLTVDDAQLLPLASNGGTTLTHLPHPDSPVIDAGDNVLCELTDQRQVVRPVDGDGDGIERCDVGAVEYNNEIIFINGFE